MELKNKFKKDKKEGRCSECIYRWDMSVCRKCNKFLHRGTMVKDLYETHFD